MGKMYFTTPENSPKREGGRFPQLAFTTIKELI
jgi:hypothetical protein